MTREAILAVLEQHSAIVDDADDRERLATALHEAMMADPDSVFVREAAKLGTLFSAALVLAAKRAVAASTKPSHGTQEARDGDA